MKNFIGIFLLLCISISSANGQFCSSRLPQSPLSECDYCIASQGVSPLEAGSSGIRWDIRSLYLETSYQGSTKLPPTVANESYLTNQLTGFYRLTNALTAVVIAPYTIRSAHEPLLAGDTTIVGVGSKQPSIEHDINAQGATTSELVRAYGLGDVIAMMRYTLVRFSEESSSGDAMADGSSAMTIVSFSAGVKLPTGRTDFMHDGEYLDSHLQPGSGSTDLILGTGLLWSFERTSIAANVLGSIPSTGARGHRFGNYVNVDLTGRYRLFTGEDDITNVAALIGLSGELRAKETEDGIVEENSGGSVLYLSPGVQWTVSEKISLEASYHLPVYHYLGGMQLGESYRIMGGVQYLF